MPPAILVPHPGGTSTPPMDRITYIPGTQVTFPPRPYNSASMSPGGSALTHCWCEQRAHVLAAEPLEVFGVLCLHLACSFPFNISYRSSAPSVPRYSGGILGACVMLRSHSRLLIEHTSYSSALELPENLSVTRECKTCLTHLYVDVLSSSCRFVCFPGHSTHLAAAANAEREREREKERERLAAAPSDLCLRPGGWEASCSCGSGCRGDLATKSYQAEGGGGA